MIKAIIFDSGGVIVNQKSLFDKFVKIFQPKNIKKFWREVNIKAIPLCKGKISEQEFWAQIAKSTRISLDKVPKNLWTKNYEKLTHLNKDVLNIIKALKQNYKLALVSNSIASHTKINEKRDIYNFFNVVILSHKIGLTKDNEKIFLIAARKLNVKPQECIFIDDIKDFVITAKSVGMKGILFKNSKKLELDLKKLLITKRY